MNDGYVRHRKEFDRIPEEFAEIAAQLHYHELHEIDEIIRHCWMHLSLNNEVNILDICARPHDLVRWALAIDEESFFKCGITIDVLLNDPLDCWLLGDRMPNVNVLCADTMEYSPPGKYDAILAHGLWNTIDATEMLKTIGKCAELLHPGGIVVTSMYEDETRGLQYQSAKDILDLKGYVLEPDFDPIPEEDSKQSVRNQYTGKHLLVLTARYSMGAPAQFEGVEEPPSGNNSLSRYVWEEDPSFSLLNAAPGEGPVDVERAREVEWILKVVRAEFNGGRSDGPKVVLDVTPIQSQFPEVCPITHYLKDAIAPENGDRVIGVARGINPQEVKIGDGLSFLGLDFPSLGPPIVEKKEPEEPYVQEVKAEPAPAPDSEESPKPPEEPIGIEDESVEAIVGVHVVGALKDLERIALFESAARVLKPGGVFAFTVDVDPHRHPFPEYSHLEALGFDCEFFFHVAPDRQPWIEPSAGGKLIYRVFARKPKEVDSHASDRTISPREEVVPERAEREAPEE